MGAEVQGRTAILLLNLGGPDSLGAVQPFLYNLFSDREIIRLGPSFLQKPLAWLISSLRSGKTRGYYSLIGGKSPIEEITSAQAAALQKTLEDSFNQEIGVYVGMRYWQPYIQDVIDQMERTGIRNILALSLYPQYSVATTGSSESRLKEAVSGRNLRVHTVDSWYKDPGYVDALAERIRDGLASFSEYAMSPDKVHVLFSAHSLPKKFIEEGDPYAKETMGTIEEVVKRVPVNWDLSYQSKSGPVKWLEPSTEEMIETLAGRGVKNLLMVPVSFVSDHIETLYEIDILYKGMAEKRGIRLLRTESLNTSASFIRALAGIAVRSLEEAGWKE